MASPLRPQFFCTRPNGTVTPLIAVDELPANITIHGAPRILTASDTKGMTSLGTVSPRAQSYVVEGVSSRASPSGYRRDDMQASLMKLISDESIPASQRLALHALLQQSLCQNWVGGANNGAAQGWVVPTTGASGGQRQGVHHNAKKEYCSYWIRHGECDYQQQGCLYKHEMPTDPAMLDKLGLRDVPRWYREKYSMPSLLPNGVAHQRAQIGHTQQWKDEVPDRATLKSIQYPPHLEINNASDAAPHHEKSSKQQSKATNCGHPGPHHSAVIPDRPHPAFVGVNSPKGAVSQKHGSKHATGKRIDLLSFDPMQDFSALNHSRVHANGLTYTNTNDKNRVLEEADRIEREEFVRSLESSMPEHQHANPFDFGASQSRTKKVQKSRRLYQPREQTGLAENSGHHHHSQQQQQQQQQPMEPVSFKSLHSNATAYTNAMSAMTSKGIHHPMTGGHRLGSGMSSDPPTRVVSPSMHSRASLSSESSPDAFFHRINPIPSVIGSKRSSAATVIHRKISPESSDDDLLCMGMGRGK